MEMINKRGYLKEDFRLFHIRDQVELELGYHYHEFDKIVLFLTGNVTYVVEGKAYFLKPWDILLVPHNQIHRPIIDPSEPYERIILWVNADYLRDHCLGGDDLRQCFTMAEEKSFSLIRPENADRVTLMKQLNTVESAMGAQEFGHELLSRTTFLQFMIELNRIALKDHTAMVKEAFRSDPKLSARLRNGTIYLYSPLAGIGVLTRPELLNSLLGLRGGGLVVCRKLVDDRAGLRKLHAGRSRSCCCQAANSTP